MQQQMKACNTVINIEVEHIAYCSLVFYLCHLFSVGFWVERSFCEQNGMFFWCNTEFVVERVMPDLLHVIPVGDDSVFDWILECKDTSLALSLITDIAVLLTHSHHHSLKYSFKRRVMTYSDVLASRLHRLFCLSKYALKMDENFFFRHTDSIWP